jgi:hypothetical protein
MPAISPYLDIKLPVFEWNDELDSKEEFDEYQSLLQYLIRPIISPSPIPKPSNAHTP